MNTFEIAKRINGADIVNAISFVEKTFNATLEAMPNTRIIRYDITRHPHICKITFYNHQGFAANTTFGFNN